jgi:hypothetical protein
MSDANKIADAKNVFMFGLDDARGNPPAFQSRRSLR